LLDREFWSYKFENAPLLLCHESYPLKNRPAIFSNAEIQSGSLFKHGIRANSFPPASRKVFLPRIPISPIVSRQAETNAGQITKSFLMPHLINFNTTHVAPNLPGQLSYASTCVFKGVCSLTCHGKEHKNTRIEKYNFRRGNFVLLRAKTTKQKPFRGWQNRVSEASPVA
jgi:hypothetical protein